VNLHEFSGSVTLLVAA